MSAKKQLYDFVRNNQFELHSYLTYLFQYQGESWQEETKELVKV